MENAVQKVVRTLGGSVTHAANVAGVNPKSVYGWLDKGVVTLPRAAKRLAEAQAEVSFEQLLFGLEPTNGQPKGRKPPSKGPSSARSRASRKAVAKAVPPLDTVTIAAA